MSHEGNMSHDGNMKLTKAFLAPIFSNKNAGTFEKYRRLVMYALWWCIADLCLLMGCSRSRLTIHLKSS